MYSTSSGRIIRPEYSERGSGGYLRRPAASLGENNNDEYTSTRRILNQGHVNCLAVDSSTPKGVDHRMEGRSEDTSLTDGGPNQDESYPAQQQEAEYMNVTTTQPIQASDTVRAGEKESPSDSAEIVNPADILESTMEVDEDYMQSHNINSVLSNNQNLILRCDSDNCDFVVMDPSELEFHRKTHHPAPGECRLCTFIALSLSDLAL